LQVSRLYRIGRHSDGGGLYLSIGKNGRRRWVFVYRDRRTKKLREMGLGGAELVSLAKARERARSARELLSDGLDPIAERKGKIDGRVPAFGQFAEELIDSLEGGWINAKHRQQWRITLRTHAAALRALPVDKIRTDDVLNILKPIWRTKHETAKRVRGRIEKVLDAAKARNLRHGENPAAWRGNLDHLLLNSKKRVRRHPAMPIDGVPGFVCRLRQTKSMAARCMEFAILTAARSNEAIGARWTEIDFDAKAWTIPGFDAATGRRMKSGREHRVPLSRRALEILNEMMAAQTGLFVFPGRDMDKPLSEDVLRSLMRWLGVKSATPHGFRSSFRDWVGERTSFPPELAEHALAHRIGDSVEQAYRRGDALERRREMMEAWANFCEAEWVDKATAELPKKAPPAKRYRRVLAAQE
jgi:integrase